MKSASMPCPWSTIALWPGLAGGSVVRVEGVRQDLGDFPGPDRPAGVTVERRYFITSHDAASAGVDGLGALARFLGEGIRGHWGIENGLHWCLDVAFREDANKTAAGHAGTNLGLVRRVAASLLKQDPGKGSVKGKRFKAALDGDYLLQVLQGFMQD